MTLSTEFSLKPIECDFWQSPQQLKEDTNRKKDWENRQTMKMIIE